MCTKLILLFSVVTVVMPTEFASQLRKCTVNDKVALNRCLSQTLEELRPQLFTGIPELNLPPLEPMHIENIVFNRGEGAVNVKALFKDVTVKGLSSFNATAINADPVSRDLRVGLFIPQLRITGNYILNGQIIILPINGNGPFMVNLNGVTVHSLGKVGVFQDANGIERLRITGTKLDFTINTIRFERLFNGNGNNLLGDTINHFLNENSQEILRDIKPEVSRQLNDLVQKVINDALSQLPVDAFLAA